MNISYEYSVPNSQKITDNPIRYSWKTGQYGECNRKCNGGRCRFMVAMSTKRIFWLGNHSDNMNLKFDNMYYILIKVRKVVKFIVLEAMIMLKWKIVNVAHH